MRCLRCLDEQSHEQEYSWSWKLTAFWRRVVIRFCRLPAFLRFFNPFWVWRSVIALTPARKHLMPAIEPSYCVTMNMLLLGDENPSSHSLFLYTSSSTSTNSITYQVLNVHFLSTCSHVSSSTHSLTSSAPAMSPPPTPRRPPSEHCPQIGTTQGPCTSSNAAASSLASGCSQHTSHGCPTWVTGSSLTLPSLPSWLQKTVQATSMVFTTACIKQSLVTAHS